MQKIEQAIQRGVKQFVILGGGYDIRGLMTAMKHPDVRIYELDRGPTRTCKLEGLSNIPEYLGYNIVLSGVNPNLIKANENMHYIDFDLSVADLENALPAALAAAGYHAGEDVLFIAEGLTMYLDEACNRRILNAASGLMSESSEFVISYSTSSMYTQISKRVQSASNELYQFFLPMESAVEFAAQSSMAVTQRFSAAHALSDIDHPNADYYKNDTKRLEIYYTFKRQEMVPMNNINDVPVIKLELPEKPEVGIESGICNIL